MGQDGTRQNGADGTRQSGSGRVGVGWDGMRWLGSDQDQRNRIGSDRD